MKAFFGGFGTGVVFSPDDGNSLREIRLYVLESDVDSLRGLSPHAKFEVFSTYHPMTKALREKDEEIARLRSILYD